MLQGISKKMNIPRKAAVEIDPATRVLKKQLLI